MPDPERNGASPADAAPTTAAPDAPGGHMAVLGRATYCWTTDTDQGLIVTSDIWARIEGGTREVLLVDPAVAQVLTAAQRLRQAGSVRVVAERDAARAELAEIRAERDRLRASQDAAHDDLAAILRELGLGDQARPTSAHQVAQDEVLPAIRRLRGDLGQEGSGDE